MSERMRVKVDGDRCQGHARCHALAPAVFEVDEYGFALAGEFEVPVEELDAAEDAAQGCPERAIALASGWNRAERFAWR